MNIGKIVHDFRGAHRNQEFVFDAVIEDLRESRKVDPELRGMLRGVRERMNLILDNLFDELQEEDGDA